ncbi:Uncharacterised protein [Mycobacterium tuberculosis]|nr:Uncharacterised protein [Mycobacterium tuberculosis]
MSKNWRESDDTRSISSGAMPWLVMTRKPMLRQASSTFLATADLPSAVPSK